MNIVESNKIIAEFMGGKMIVQDRGINIIEMIDGSTFDLHGLKYHSSWDLLMIVVEKIENLSFNGRKVWTTIKTFNTSRDENYHEMKLRIYDSEKSDSKFLLEYDSEWYETKIEAVYNAIVEFIKWYNENGK